MDDAYETVSYAIHMFVKADAVASTFSSIRCPAGTV